MTSIPQCTYCKYGKIENGMIICEKHEQIPTAIKNGNRLCQDYQKA